MVHAVGHCLANVLTVLFTRLPLRYMSMDFHEILQKVYEIKDSFRQQNGS